MTSSHTLPIHHLLQFRYRIEKVIGQGGFGITYKAFDEKLKKVVCIKELFILGNSTRSTNHSVVSLSVGKLDFPYFKEKFLEEAQKLAAFSHPGIVKVLDFLEENHTAYMIMDYIEGKNLKQYVEEKGMLSVEEAMNFFLQLLDAVEKIHERKMLHRDIKPDNILITPDKRVVLIDFGTAKFQLNEVQTAALEQSTVAVATPGYAPPEQYLTDSKKDNYTDIYSLGASLYFMFTGKKPLNIPERGMHEMPKVSQLNPRISKTMEDAIEKAMELKPDLRFQSVEGFRNALQQQGEIKPEEDIQTEDEDEEKLWKNVCLLDDEASYKYYLKKYPEGRYIEYAKDRIKQIFDNLVLLIISFIIIIIIAVIAELSS